jgi:hypothetical protein
MIRVNYISGEVVQNYVEKEGSDMNITKLTLKMPDFQSSFNPKTHCLLI